MRSLIERSRRVDVAMANYKKQGSNWRRQMPGTIFDIITNPPDGQTTSRHPNIPQPLILSHIGSMGVHLPTFTIKNPPFIYL